MKSFFLYVFLFYKIRIIVLCCNNGSQNDVPLNWPREWNDGVISFTYNFYLLSPKRLISIVQRGIDYIEARSCLIFKESNPIELARSTNTTYIFFTFSDVLENCCLPYSIYYRRRVVLITPLCTLPVEVAHAILHAMGLRHMRHKPFSKQVTRNVLFPFNCTKMNKKNSVVKKK